MAPMDRVMVATSCGALVGVEKEVSSRDIPFDPKAICQECGQEGSLDFYGDSYCSDCLSSEIPNCFYADPPTLREFFEGLVELFRMGIKRLL